jgi:hypothetical protein
MNVFADRKHRPCLRTAQAAQSEELFCVSVMERPTTGIKKTRGHPKQDPFSAVRLSSKLTAAIDKWAEENGVSSRAEAIRRLVELGLSSSKPLHRRNLEAASKALELAAQELDKLVDPSASDEERTLRKRRLLRGPKEFRDLRGDVSKSKR